MSNKLSVQYVPITELKASVYNPRKWSKDALSDLKESIKRFDCVDPIIVNGYSRRKNIVIGGHMRLTALKELKYKEAPVAYINISSVKKEKELNIRLNKNTGEWDWEKLKAFDVDALLDIGFETSELEGAWGDVLETEDDGFDVEKEIKAIKKPKSKLGQVWKLGNHRLICGDAHDPAVIKQLMDATKANMVYCDPIYNISLDYNAGIGGKAQYGGTVKDSKSDTDYEAFLNAGLQNALSVAHKDCHVFYWCDQKYIWLVQQLFTKHELTNKRVCMWIKNSQNPTPQVAFNKCYEPCVYATLGKPYLAKKNVSFNEILNKNIETGNSISEDILDMLDIWLVKRLSGAEYQHATAKPPTLHEKALRRCTKPKDVVLDLYLGSGSTLISCEQMNRVCYGCEIEPIFCDLIIKRYEYLTGTKAELISNTKTHGQSKKKK